MPNGSLWVVHRCHQVGRGTIPGVSTKWLSNWANDLRGLSDEGVRKRLAMAIEYERASMAKGMGRNPKAARMWREKIRDVEAEMERRGIRP